MVTLGDIANVCNGKIIGVSADKIIYNTTIDSRECNNNSLFIAINSELLDNTYYLNTAISKGATIISEEKYSAYSTLTVNNSFDALKNIALLYRKKNAGRVLAVTGSVGKTTVKELCVSIIKKSGKLRLNYTEGNKNNTLGMPLTLMKGGKFDITVLEAGISEQGEMQELAKIARPDIALITNIGKMHSEHLGSFEDTACEKLKITSFMPENGTLLIPSDNNFLIENSPKNIRTLTVGEEKNADFLIENIRFVSGGTLFSVKSKEQVFYDVFTPIIGRHGALDSAFALAAATLLNISENDVRDGLISYTPCGDRQKIIKAGSLTVISDCYNAGPESMSASFDAFSQIYRENGSPLALKVLLLGDMLELGANAEAEHFAIGRLSAKLQPDLIITYGSFASQYAEGALSAGASKKCVKAFNPDENDKILKLLEALKHSNAVILIKGSRKMKLERFTAYLTN